MQLVIAIRREIPRYLYALRADAKLLPNGRFFCLAWGPVAIFAVVDFIWLSFSRLSFAPTNIQPVFSSLAVALAAHCGARLAIFPSRIAAGIRHAAEGLDVLSRTVPFVIALGFTGTVFAWVATCAALPLQDARLAALDQALGFDWLSFLSFANAHTAVSWGLVKAYHSTGPLLLMVYLWLSFTKRQARLEEFLALLAMTSLGTGIGMALVPAAGAYAYFDPPRELFANFSANAGMWHYELLLALRTEAVPILDFAKTKGMVTFPSFHTVLAIITTYAVRDARGIALPVLTLNAVMIVSTLPEGGHHLVDLIAGVAIAGLAILIIRLRQDGAVALRAA